MVVIAEKDYQGHLATLKTVLLGKNIRRTDYEQVRRKSGGCVGDL